MVPNISKYVIICSYHSKSPTSTMVSGVFNMNRGSNYITYTAMVTIIITIINHYLHVLNHYWKMWTVTNDEKTYNYHEPTFTDIPQFFDHSLPQSTQTHPSTPWENHLPAALRPSKVGSADVRRPNGAHPRRVVGFFCKVLLPPNWSVELMWISAGF